MIRFNLILTLLVMARNCIWIAVVVLLSSCSISFSQLDTARLWLRLDERPLAAVEWSAQWNGEELLLYATNSGFEDVFLLGTDVRLYFSDFQFNEVVGIFPNAQKVLIENNEGEFSFWVDSQLLAREACDDWQLSADWQLSKGYPADRYIQSCTRIGGSNVGFTYQNEIDVSATSLITRLHFVIHPEYSPITITLSGNEE